MELLHELTEIKGNLSVQLIHQSYDSWQEICKILTNYPCIFESSKDFFQHTSFFSGTPYSTSNKIVCTVSTVENTLLLAEKIKLLRTKNL